MLNRSGKQTSRKPDATPAMGKLRPPRGPLRIALEPRMLFDGAAIATAVAHLDQPAAAHPRADAPGSEAHDAHEGHGAGRHDAANDRAAGGHDGAAAALPQAADAGSPHVAQAAPAEADAALSRHADAGMQDSHRSLLDAVAAIAPLDASAAASAAASHTVVFIDQSLPNVGQLIAAVPTGAQVVMLDPTMDGLQQVEHALAGRTDIEALHFLTHGNVGEFEVGNTVLDAQSISADKSGLLAEIAKHLSVGADVLVYGCDFGQGAEGAAAMQALSHALGADVAASDDATGSAALHGNWILEEHVGAIHTQAIDAAGWDGLLFGLPIVATADVAVVQINGSVGIDAVANDIDLNNSRIVLTGATALHGAVAINTNNTLQYTPTAGYFGADTITYTVRDGVGATNAAGLPGLVAVTINPLSLPTLPVFQEDTPIVFASLLGTQVSLGNINGNLAHVTLSVPNGGLTLGTTANVGLSHGTGTNDASVTIDGSVAAINAALNGLTYTPGADYNGPVNLTISLPNALGLTVTTQLPISIAPVADIVPDFVHTLPGQSVGFNVLANDTFENPGRYVSSHTNPAHGTLTIDAQGQSTYVPTAGFNGTDTFNYTVTSNGTTETTSVTIFVGNHAPVATPIAAQSFNDAQTVSLATAQAFSDADHDTLTYSATGLPGGLSINATTGVISGTVGGHASVAVAGGNYAVVVTANDGFGGSVAQTIQVHVSNPPPIAINDGAVGVNTTAVSGNVLLNDYDPDGDALSVSTTPVVAPTHGTVVLQANGNYVYTPNGNFVGTDTFTYRVNDTDGGSATAVVTLVIAAPVNQPPVAVADTAFVNANGSVVINVLANDTDPENDVLHVTTASAAHGTVTKNPDGTLLYVPVAGFTGVDLITYGLQDSHGNNALVAGTVVVTVNAAPTLHLPNLNPLYEDTPVVFASGLGTQITVGDIDGNFAQVSLSVPIGKLTLAQTTGITLDQGSGTSDTTVSFHGTIAAVNAALDGLVYTPGADYNGPVTITVGLSDGLINVPITVGLPLYIQPVADIVPDTVTTTQGHNVTFNVLANDTFENPTRVVSSYTTPAHGSVTIDAQGNASYNPTAGFIGTDVFNYTVTSNGTTETTTVTVTVTAPVNHPPTATPISDVSANDAQAITINAGSAFSDADGNALTYSATGLPTGITIDPTTGIISGTLGGHASQGVAGGVYNIVVTANDGHGGTVTDTFHLNVANPAPIANDDNAVGFNTSVVYGNVLTNDSDPDGDALSISTTPLVAPTHGTVVLNANGSYAYTANAGFVGTDTFTYRLIDADGGTASATVHIAISTPVNNLPIAAPDTAFVNAGSSTTINVLANDSDPNGYALSVSSATALHGTVITNPDGTLNYTPTAGFHGTDTISYGLVDSHGNQAAVNGTVTVTVNALPTLQLPNLPVLYEDTPVVFSSGLGTQISVGDVDGNVARVTLSVPLGALTLSQTTGLSFSQGTGTNDTTVTFQGTIAAVNAALNGLVYTPGADYNGPVTLTIGLTDTLLNTPITTQLALNITPVADIVPDSETAITGHSVGFNVLSNDTFENPGRYVSSYTTPAHGTVSIDAQGNAIYNPTTGFAGTDTFNYTVTSNGTTETTTVTITVNHTAPTASTLADVAANDAQTISVATAAAFHDSDGNTLTYSVTGLPAGLAIDAGTGVISGTLGGHASVAVPGGVYNVTVTADDGQGGTVAQTFHITVANPPPIAVNDSGTGSAGGTISGNVLTNDHDPDGDALTVATTPVTAPQHGSVALNADGSYVYTPQAGYVGTDSFTYRVTDSDGGSATAVVSLTITSVNHAPTSTALPDQANSVGATVSVAEGSHFSDVDGDALVYTATGLPPGLSINATTGVISGTLTTVGNYHVTVTGTDPSGLSTSQTFAWATTPVADNGPNTVGTLPAAGGADAGAVSLATAGGFADPDGDTLHYSATGLPSGLSIDAATGVISGTLGGHASVGGTSGNSPGVYIVYVTADDGHGGSAVQGFRFTATNPAPIAVADTATGAENSALTGNVLTNDYDPDGDALRVGTTPVVTPTHGSLVLNADGSYVYTPQTNFHGTDSFTYLLIDADGGTATATVTLTVTAVNHAPTSTPLPDQTNTVGTPVTISEAAHFNDADGDPLTYSATGLPPGLSIDVQTGVISGTPSTVGNYAVTVTATDPSGLATSQAFHWTTALVGDNGPNTVGTLPTSGANDATAVSIATATAFNDPDGDVLHYSASGLPSGLSIDTNTGVISGTLNSHASVGGPNGNGVYTIVVTADDGRGGSVAQGFTFTATNPAPIAVADTGTGNEGGVIAGNVLANDSDPDGDALTVGTSPVVPPAHGTLVLNADGSYVYTPFTNFHGVDSFTYRVTDADGGTATATVTLTVTAVNHAPTSTAPANEANTVGTAITVSEAAHFNDVDGDALVYTASGLPPGLSIDAATGVITGTSTVVGNYAVTLTASDPSGASTSQTFGWVITTGPDHAPTIAATLPAGGGNDAATVSIATAAGFHDADGDALSYSATGLPSGLSINATTGVISGTLDGHASVGGNHGVYTIVVTADDGRGGSVAQGFTFTASNPAPIAVADSGSGVQGGTITGNVLTNDSDPDGDALTVATAPVVAPLHGTVLLNADGSYVYTPQVNFHGTDSFTYRLIDADGGTATATVTLTITGVNHAPTSTPLPDQVNTVGTPVTISEAAHFSDVDGDALTYSATGLPPGLTIDVQTGVISGTPSTVGNYAVTVTATDPSGLGTSQAFHWTTALVGDNGPNTVGTLPTSGGNDATAVGIATATAFNDPDGDVLHYSASGLPSGLSIDTNTGVISGTLNSHASVGGPYGNGVYTIVVTADDGRGGSVAQGFTFTAANPAPIAVADSGSGVQGGTVTGNVLVNDSDPDGDALSVGTTPAAAPMHGVLVLNADGSYVYTPNAGFHGTDSFTYRLFDADGGTATATVTLTIAAVNHAPTSTPLADQTNTVGTAVSVSEAAHFTDSDGDALVYTASGLPPGLGIDAGTGVISGTSTTTGHYAVTLTATDPSGASTSQTFNWVVSTVLEHAPTIAALLPTGSGNDATAVSIATAAGFVDSDGDTLTYSATGLPTGLSINAATGVISGTLDGHASVGGNHGVYTIVVTADDGRGGSVAQGFTFTASNPAPIAVADTATVNAGGVAVGNVLTNDHDPDGDALTVATTPVVAPTHGALVLNADGSYVYTPQAGFQGTDSFTYRLIDADGGTATATVTLTVVPINHAPTSTPIADQSNTIGTTVSVAEGPHFTDVDQDPLVYSATGLPPGLSIDPRTGVITGTLTSLGSYAVTLTATDPAGLSTTQTFNWTSAVTGNNSPNSVGFLATGTGADAGPVRIATAAAFNDPDGNTLTFSASGLPPGLSIDPATGIISGTLGNHASVTGTNGNGIYDIVVTANDGHGGIAEQAFRFTAFNPAPIAVADTASGSEGGTVSGNVLTNDRDPDGDTLTVVTTPVVMPAHGTVILNADGSYVYTPAANFHGTDSFTYRVMDADGGSSTATVTLTIAAANNAPTSTTLADLPVTAGMPVSIATAGHFADVDGDTLVYTATGLPQGLTIDPATGVISGTLDGHASTGGGKGVYTVIVTVDDGHGGTVSQGFTLTASNPGPTTTAGGTTILTTGPVAGNLLSGVIDPAGDPLHVEPTAIVLPAHGTIVVNADGSYVYTPLAGFAGNDVFTYRVADGDGRSVEVSVNVIVGNGTSPSTTRSGTTGTSNPTTTGSGSTATSAGSTGSTGTGTGTTTTVTTTSITGLTSPASSLVNTTIDPLLSTFTVTRGAAARGALGTFGDTLETATQSQSDLDLDTGGAVIIAAVNGIKRLDGLGNLAGTLPLNASINAINPLGNSPVLVGGVNPMSQVVGDLNDGFKTPFRVGGNPEPGPSVQGALPATAAGGDPVAWADFDAPFLGARSATTASVGVKLNNPTELPITLTAQLRLATLKTHRELDALADLLT